MAVASNRALAAVLDQFTPVVRRAERLRFSSLGGARRSPGTTSSSGFVPPGTRTRRRRSPSTPGTACRQSRSDHGPVRLPTPPADLGPSPVHPLPRLTAHLGGASVWAKREDCNAGFAYGGNKTRKLEYIVPDVLAQGADTLVSIGGYQSNHTRQVAAVAASLGLKAVLVQENWVDWPDCVSDRVGNIMLSRIMGAEVRLDPAGFGIGFKDSWTRAIEDVKKRGGRPYPIPAVPPTTGSAASGSRTGRTRSSSKNANWAPSSTPSWSARSPARPRRA